MMQYSSNEGDLVCDLFLGGFSTAKVAIGLNRRATGFEISPSMFDTKIEEMKAIEPGFLLPALRCPEIEELANQGKSWTDEDMATLILRFNQLTQSGKTKKESIELLEEELGRGRWSIEKMLKKLGVQFNGGKRGRPKKQPITDAVRDQTVLPFE